MSKEIEKLVQLAKQVPETPNDRERQRRSFAYGNTAIENPLITREMVEEQADRMAAESTERNE
ncbi:MAG: hypothetical protein IT562_07710 [Alphaproteobacteria bacterium]|nr:hypothetical protein [Alphaproteobacteria bacterium]